MDKAIDLSQPEYKRFRLGKLANNVVNKFSRRNNSIDQTSSQKYQKPWEFIDLKHPYEWNIKQLKKDPTSYIRSPSEVSTKVNNMNFASRHYKSNVGNNDPMSTDNQIAERMRIMYREKLNNSTIEKPGHLQKTVFLNTKYLKNYSTIGDSETMYNLKTHVLDDPRSMTNFFKNKAKKPEISLKVGNNSVSFFFHFWYHFLQQDNILPQVYSPKKEKYQKNVQYVSPPKGKFRAIHNIFAE
jgi:hypothetical protein